MAKKITRKELLKSDDEFLTLSARAAAFIASHRPQIKYVGIGIAAVAVLYLAGSTYFRYLNRVGQQAYNEAYYTLKENMKPGAASEETGKGKDLFQKVIDDYGLSKAARLALPESAYEKFLQKDYDAAILQYQEFQNTLAKGSPYRPLTSLALAACHEAKGELEMSLKILEPALDLPDNPFRESVMLSLARLYRNSGQAEKEKKILERFVETYETSPFLPMVKARLS
jgi:predicted negative regulator of RcsB-dependent stress response